MEWIYFFSARTFKCFYIISIPLTRLKINNLVTINIICNSNNIWDAITEMDIFKFSSTNKILILLRVYANIPLYTRHADSSTQPLYRRTTIIAFYVVIFHVEDRRGPSTPPPSSRKRARHADAVACQFGGPPGRRRRS